jgi:hypothetical protein
VIAARRHVVPSLAGLTLWAGAALAQEAGWNYSPYPGEGDRAAMGCTGGSTPDRHVCLAVRCEDDYSVALYVKTTRAGGDVGEWTIQIDDAALALVAEPAPGLLYGGRFTGEVATIIEALKNGAVAFLDPVEGEPPSDNGINLSGSLYAINQALFFCAPRVVPPAVPISD